MQHFNYPSINATNICCVYWRIIKVLHFIIRRAEMCAWVEVWTYNPRNTAKFYVVATLNEIIWFGWSFKEKFYERGYVSSNYINAEKKILNHFSSTMWLVTKETGLLSGTKIKIRSIQLTLLGFWCHSFDAVVLRDFKVRKYFGLK